jgi:hypothetical protein
MKTFLSKLNFIIGILLVIPFLFIGKILEDLARVLFGIVQDIAFAFDFMGVMGGYVAMFWEKLFTEGIGTFVFCAVSLCGPIFLNKKFFPKFKINWIPAIALVSIYFIFFGLTIIVLFFKGFGKLDWIDTISYLVMTIGYFGGFIAGIITSLTYGEVEHPLIEKFK